MREKVKNLRQSDGFTIIEVLIVLAIAGLIMLIVFLAVPALQRNSRNTQRKSDASAMLTAVSEFTSNNNGVPPAAADLDKLKAIVPISKRAYYKDDTKITLTTNPGAADISVTDPEAIQIVLKKGCADTGGQTKAGPSRSVAVLYAVESTSGTVGLPQCIESGV